MSRKFELLSTETDTRLLPERSTAHSAGYDIKSAEDIVIEPGQIKLVKTNIKANMNHNEVLYLYDRSSNPRKKGIVLINSVGVIDSDYYNNPDNEGHIMGQFMNITDKPVKLKRGERMMQGVFMKYLTVDDDSATGSRMGGFGSTGK